MLNFYKIFEESYENKLKSAMGEAQSDIKECEFLVGWDSNNFHILKSTVDKFHKKIYKIGKKFKEFLNQNTDMVLFLIKDRE